MGDREREVKSLKRQTCRAQWTMSSMVTRPRLQEGPQETACNLESWAVLVGPLGLSSLTLPQKLRDICYNDLPRV